MTDSLSTIKTLLLRDLRGMQTQLGAYNDEADMWKSAPGVSNSAGTLVLHCVGNLRHFIGATLGETGYVRDRDGEFKARDLPREALLALLNTAIQEVSAALVVLSPDALGEPMRLPGGKCCTRERFLHHLCTHLSYHLGQIDYHRRILTGADAVGGMLALGALDPGE